MEEFIYPCSPESLPEFYREIVSGTEEEAVGVLRKIEQYEPIPGSKYMTRKMIARMLDRTPQQVQSLYLSMPFLRPLVRHGNWTGYSPGVIGIRDLLSSTEEGRNIISGEGQERFSHLELHNGAMNLYPPRVVLCLALKSKREDAGFLARMSRTVYAERLAEQHQKMRKSEKELPPAEIDAPAGIPIPAAGDLVTTGNSTTSEAATMTPEFMASVISAVVRETVAAVMERIVCS